MGAVLAGVLFATWGYLHNDVSPTQLSVIVSALSVMVPLLFSIGLLALHAQGRGGSSRLRGIGFLFALFGSVLGASYQLAVVLGLADVADRYGYAVARGWPPPLLDWFTWLLAGITLVGIGFLRPGRLPGRRLLPLIMGICGWVYYLFDSDETVWLRTAHIVFGMLFSLTWVVLGYLLWSEDFEAKREQ